MSTVTSLSPRDEGDEDEEGRSDNRKASGIILRSKGVRLEVLATYRNIAPIMDAVLADPEFSGQVRELTISSNNDVYDTCNVDSSHHLLRRKQFRISERCALRCRA